MFDEYLVTLNKGVILELNNVFENEEGRFRLYLHDRGMELLLVNQWWLNTKKRVHEISPGSTADIVLQKRVNRALSKPDKANQICQADWNSQDYYECIDEVLENVREPFHCRSPFDIALNQSRLEADKPICSSFNDTFSLTERQEQVFMDLEFQGKCPKNCDVVSYKTSMTNVKMFGRNKTATIYIIYGALNTIMDEEIPVYDSLTIISVVGGSLGLFLGFSFLDMALWLIEILKNGDLVG
ncbi:uncharacterized protein LOC131889940 [Tigriopus californicus]|uniref:uncharacterized protein LOC131889940 n=1 Tax=Tigriopus californicus TaxID=6832 RepID=UPI0027DA49FD|nr:uncharacterized protein LOC131889940 [Tigriopus californicus]